MAFSESAVGYKGLVCIKTVKPLGMESSSSQQRRLFKEEKRNALEVLHSETALTYVYHFAITQGKDL